jgi:hypothetical protein
MRQKDNCRCNHKGQCKCKPKGDKHGSKKINDLYIHFWDRTLYV